MWSTQRYDAVVIGSGPNGLAAAITLSRAGLHVLLVEAGTTVGGGVRSGPLTLPGFQHDICSAVHPFGRFSPAWQHWPLDEHGLRWVTPPAALAHPLESQTILLTRDLDQTADQLESDGSKYRALVSPLLRDYAALLDETLRPLIHLPQHPVLLARFGVRALLPATLLARTIFRHPAARALFAGLAGHAQIPLTTAGSSAVALMLALAGHAHGWPFPSGGAGALSAALRAYFESLGGEVVTDCRVDSLKMLPEARAVLLDVSPRQLVKLAGQRLPAAYRTALDRFKPGPGVYKVDYALRGPIPWRDPSCAQAMTVHLGGTLDEITWSERQVALGQSPDRPYVLVTQPSLFDAGRAPDGQHTAWAYCHVPNGSDEDMTARIDAQLSRYAPGFQDVVLARHSMNAPQFAAYNPNYIGGDIGGGAATLRQLLARPVLSPSPYRTPLKNVYLCSASTPPGAGVHGMCGLHAANLALRDQFGHLDHHSQLIGHRTESLLS